MIALLLLTFTSFIMPSTNPTTRPANGFQCTDCGQWHEEMPMDMFYALPSYVASIPENERDARVVRRGDFIIVDNEHHFLRVLLELPIKNSGETFSYGVWGSLSKKNFDRALAIYDDPKASEDEPEYFSWLNNSIEQWPQTINLKTMIKLKSDARASMILEPTDHPLAAAQREGIELDRVREIVDKALHPVKP